MNLSGKWQVSNNVKKIQIIKTLALKWKVKRHFMKWNDNALEGDKHYGNFFLFYTNRFQLFFVSKMSVEESFMEKLRIQSKEKLLKLKKEQKNRKSNKNLQTICFYNLGLQKEVCLFLLQFILLLILKIFFSI